MNKSSTTKKQSRNTQSNESVSRQVAEELHENIDKAAAKGEQLEQELHERGQNIQDNAQHLQSGLKKVVRDNPWLVAGGSLALGFLLGSLIKRN